MIKETIQDDRLIKLESRVARVEYLIWYVIITSIPQVSKEIAPLITSVWFTIIH